MWFSAAYDFEDGTGKEGAVAHGVMPSIFADSKEEAIRAVLKFCPTARNIRVEARSERNIFGGPRRK